MRKRLGFRYYKAFGDQRTESHWEEEIKMSIVFVVLLIIFVLLGVRKPRELAFGMSPQSQKSRKQRMDLAMKWLRPRNPEGKDRANMRLHTRYVFIHCPSK